MTNTLFNIVYKIQLPKIILTKKEEIFTDRNIGERNLTSTMNLGYEYSYSNNSANPYLLTNYFNGINRQNSIIIYKGKIEGQVLGKVNGNTKLIGDIFKTNDAKQIKTRYLKDKTDITVTNNSLLNLTYIKSLGINDTEEARKETAKSIAEKLGKLENERFTLNEGYYKPTSTEMIILHHILVREIRSKGTRTDVMWQREKAAILWCVINAVGAKIAGATEIIHLVPQQRETKFKGYLSGGRDDTYYRDMQLSGSISPGAKNLYNSAQTVNGQLYNFELFIDAFFRGWFPNEVGNSTNWSHRSGLIRYSPFHLPSGFKIQNKDVLTSKGKALSLDGNIILTNNGSTASVNDDLEKLIGDDVRNYNDNND